MRLGTLIEDVVGGSSDSPEDTQAVEGVPPRGAPTETEDETGARVEDLEHRIEGVEADVEEVTRHVEGVQSSQEEVAGQIEDLEGTIRRLVGLYDQVAADANPFADDGESNFGVVGEETVEDGTDVVSFGDLEADAGTPADADEPGVESASTGAEATPTDHERDVVPDHEPEGQTDPADDAQSDVADDVRRRTTAQEETAGLTSDRATVGNGEAYLESPLCHNYASDFLVFEWLSELVAAAGPAAALRAVEYYERIGWIDEDVKSYLEDALSGPVLDVDVDPRQPQELTASDHAKSYEYIVTLETLNSMGETER